MFKYKSFRTNQYAIPCKCYYPEKGTLSGVVIGVHGFAGDKESSMLNILAKALNSQHKALFCFDFPCHGTSPVNEEQLTIKNCMQDLLYIAEYCRNEFREGENGIFATSFGGYIAILCAEFLKDYKIVLRAPAVTMPEHILTDIVNLSPTEFENRQKVKCGFDRPIMLPYSFYKELQQYPVMTKRLSDEMLIIHGDRDNVVPYDDILTFCNHHPSVQLKVIPGADHRFKRSGDTDAVVKAAIQFWNDHWGEPGIYE